MADSIIMSLRALRAENMLFETFDVFFFYIYISDMLTETTKPNNITGSYTQVL